MHYDTYRPIRAITALNHTDIDTDCINSSVGLGGSDWVSFSEFLLSRELDRIFVPEIDE